MKKEFNTPEIEILRMQVSEELTLSGEPNGEAIGFGLRGIATVEDLFN